MSDIHALSGAYAVDALDDAERTRFEEHLAVCAECRAEVTSFQETTALLCETEAQTPPASLRQGVLSGIGRIRPLPPEPTRPGRVGALGGPAARRRRWPQLLVAAAAAVVLAVGLLTWHPWQHDRTTLADQILHAGDAASLTRSLPGGGELTLVRSPSIGRAVMTASGVPEPPPGRTYQLWLQQPGHEMVSAGLMPDSRDPAVLAGDASTATAAAVSVEPARGSPHPTTPPIAVFTLRAAHTGAGGT